MAVIAASGVVVMACEGSGDDAYIVRSGTVISNKPNMAVLVDQRTIQKIGPKDSIRAADAAQRVDATGKYVVPDYGDMHTHAMVRIDVNPSYFPLMIANGVTSFCEAGDFPGTG